MDNDAGNPPGERPKILIVDSAGASNERTRQILEAAGFTALVFTQSLGASSEIFKNKPDLVLIEVDMPALSGSRLIGVIRRLADVAKTRLAFFANRPDDELEALAKAADADGWISKSSDGETLVSEVRRLVAAPLVR